MKYFLSLLVISMSAYSQSDVQVQRVRNVDVKDGTANISFYDVERVYKLPENSGIVPCLKNGWEAPQKVLIKVDPKKNTITDCKLYSAGVLGFEDESLTPKAQAQEEKKSKK